MLKFYILNFEFTVEGCNVLNPESIGIEGLGVYCVALFLLENISKQFYKILYSCVKVKKLLILIYGQTALE